MQLRDELSWAGHGNFVGTAGTFRDVSEGSEAHCAFEPAGTDSNGILYGLPAGSKVVKAHLTWAASGDNADYEVTLNNKAISAESNRRYTYTFNSGNDTLEFFSGAADVTNQIKDIMGETASGANYTFSFNNLSYDGRSDKFCRSGRAYAGWALVIIYELDTDPLRLVNVFEGFDMFWGSNLQLQPKNFQVPAELPTGFNYGKHAHITWEGDSLLNSQRNGFTEDLEFEGSTLSFGAGSVNPPGAQYNATIADETLPSSTYVTNSYGVDFDVYDISDLVTPKATDVTTIYEAGQDRVFLTTEVLSILNVNVADLEVKQPINENAYTRGSTETIRVEINNNGPFDSSGNLITTVELDDDLTLFGSTSFNNNDWSCTQVSTTPTVLECSKDKNFVNGETDYFEIPVTVSSDAANTLIVNVSIPGVLDDPNPNIEDNHYPIPGGNFDNVISNNKKVFEYNVINGQISLEKTVDETFDGIFEAGDTITYTVTLKADLGAAATGMSVIDQLPQGITGFSYDFSTLEAQGIINNSTSTEINLSNIDISVDEEITILFSATIDPAANINTIITNTVMVDYGAADTIDATAGLVITDIIPATTEKQLYLYSTGDNKPDGMSRKKEFTGNQKYVPVQKGTQSCITTPQADNCQIWTLKENLVADLQIDQVDLHLLLRDNGTGTGDSQFYLAIVESDNDDSTPHVVIAEKEVDTVFPSGAPTMFIYKLTGSGTVAKGKSISLVVENRSSEDSGEFRVKPSKGDGRFSEVRIHTPNVINVDSIKFYDAPYVDEANSNGATEITNIGRASAGNEESIYVRAIVSDPFGTFDIENVSATLTDTLGNVKADIASLPRVEIPGDLILAEFSYTVNSTDELGDWQVSITADEGKEGIISHTLSNTFNVFTPPELTITKQVALASSPSSPITNAQPMDILQYQFEITNISEGDAVNLIVNENISPYSALCFISDTPVTDTFACSNCADVAITTENTEFSQNNDSNFIFSPSPIAASSPNGRCNFTDNNVTNVQIKLNGTLEPQESITFTYQVVVN